VPLREMPDGTIITFDGDGADFAHPFQVSLIGKEAASCAKALMVAAERARCQAVAHASRFLAPP